MRLPTKERVHAAVGATEVKTGLFLKDGLFTQYEADWWELGMAMALAILYSGDTLVLVAAYESGHAAVYRLNEGGGSWSTTYLQNPHSQPGEELTLLVVV